MMRVREIESGRSFVLNELNLVLKARSCVFSVRLYRRRLKLSTNWQLFSIAFKHSTETSRRITYTEREREK